MKKFSFLLSLFVIGALISSCGKSDDPVLEPTPVPSPTPTPNPTPSVVTPTITIVETPSTVAQSGGEMTVKFNASDSWSASSAESWCTVAPLSGNAGDVSITIKVSENTTFDERNSQVTIKSGSVSKSFTVTQKQKDALTVTSNKIETSAEKNSVKIEVKSNVDYTYSIAEDATWIHKRSSTRALTSSIIELDIDENTSFENREGVVSIISGDLSEQVTIYQQGDTPQIILSQKEYSVPSTGGSIKVELKSNTDYSIVLPDIEWITESKTRALSSYTHYFEILENELTDSRSAVIKFVNNEEGIEESIIISQAQKDAIIVAEKRYTVECAGGTLEFEIETNVDFDVTISEDWIKQSNSTRALSKKKLSFIIDENTTEDPRSAKITLTSGDIEQEITVEQDGPFKLDSNTMVLLVGQTKSTNIPPVVTSVESSNEFAVKINEKGEISGLHVGGSWLTINGKYTMLVMVMGFYDYLNEACTDWGKTPSEIKEKHSGYRPTSENEKALIYDNLGNFTRIGYVFEDNKLTGTAVYVPTGNLSKISSWMKERYILMSDKNYIYSGVNGLKFDSDPEDMPILNSTATTIMTVDSGYLGSKSVYAIVFMSIEYLQRDKAPTRASDSQITLMERLNSIMGFTKEAK